MTEQEKSELHQKCSVRIRFERKRKLFQFEYCSSGMTAAEENVEQEENSRKFSFLEYHKWRFDAEWYFNIAGKLVMATSAKMGYLGSYNSALGYCAF